MDTKKLVFLVLAALILVAGVALTILTSLPTFDASQPAIEEPSRVSTGTGLVTLTVVPKKGGK